MLHLDAVIFSTYVNLKVGYARFTGLPHRCYVLQLEHASVDFHLFAESLVEEVEGGGRGGKITFDDLVGTLLGHLSVNDGVVGLIPPPPTRTHDKSR